MKISSKLLSIVFLLATQADVLAQCAMCKASVENNATNGEGMGLAAGLNFGILYLFVAPYLIIGAVAFFWYRNSKKNAAKKRLTLNHNQDNRVFD